MTFKPVSEAYLDIETTGLSPQYAEITVIGIYVVEEGNEQFIQLVGKDCSALNLVKALEGANTIYTYNGSRFDLPFIRDSLGIDLADLFSHHDLMYDCWKCNLYGGFKKVEMQLGINRKSKDMNGYDAIILWQRYQHSGDKKALKKLLYYNKEDVINLKVLREKLSDILW